MNSEFFIYFDLINQGFDYYEWFLDLIWPFIGVFLFFIFRKKSRLFLPLSIICLFMLCVPLSIANIAFYKKYKSLTYRLESKECTVIEGYPENFIYRPLGAHSTESFYLNGKKFEYADGLNNGLGFNKTVATGGLIKQGIYIRLHYYQNHILRVEIRK